jgi:hypothetical protein
VVVQENPEQQTIIHCDKLIQKNSDSEKWFSLNPKTYLINEQKLPGVVPIQLAYGIPISPKRMRRKKHQEILSFTLVFGAVPNNWRYFTLREESTDNNGIIVPNIWRNTSGIYQIILS